MVVMVHLPLPLSLIPIPILTTITTTTIIITTIVTTTMPTYFLKLHLHLHLHLQLGKVLLHTILVPLLPLQEVCLLHGEVLMLNLLIVDLSIERDLPGIVKNMLI